MKLAVLACLATFGLQVSPAPALASGLTDSARIFHQDTSNIKLLMKVVGQSRSFAIKGCPSAVELIIRSYNAYIFKEKPNSSYMVLASQASLCKPN